MRRYGRLPSTKDAKSMICLVVLKRCFILQLSFVLNPIITASLAD